MPLKNRVFTAAAAFAGVASAVAAGPSTGETSGPRILSIKECIRLALEHNLDIQIARYNPKISYYGLEASYGAWDPTFSAGGNHFFSQQAPSVTSQEINIPGAAISGNSFNSSLSGVAPSGLNYSLVSSLGEQYGNTALGPLPKTSTGSAGIGSLSQPLLKNMWIDTPRLTIAVGKNRLKYNEIGLRQQIITTVTTVKNAYYDLIADEENIKVNKEAVRLAQTLLDNNKKQVQVGTMAPLDITQAESQLAQSKANLLVAEQVLVQQQNLIKNLLTDNFSTWAEIELHPSEKLVAVLETPDLHDSWRLGLRQRPDLLQAKLDLERIGIQLKFDKNQIFPDLELTGSYRYTGSSTLNSAAPPVNGNGSGGQFSDVFNQIGGGDLPSYGFGASLTFPLSNKAARNQYKQDKMSKEQLALTFKKVEQAAMVAIANDVKSIESTYQQVDATREARVYADQALQAEQKKLDNGSSTVFVVLQLQNNLTAAKFSEIQALDNYNKAIETLASDTGSTIERNHINLESR
jgi:outer membrane protein TolC